MHAHIICNANGSVLHLAAGVPWWCICGAKENTRPQLCDPGLPAEPSRPSSCDPRRTGTNLCLLSLVPPSPTKHQSENKQCSCRMLCTNVSICFNINNRQMQHETAFLVQSAWPLVDALHVLNRTMRLRYLSVKMHLNMLFLVTQAKLDWLVGIRQRRTPGAEKRWRCKPGLVCWHQWRGQHVWRTV